MFDENDYETTFDLIFDVSTFSQFSKFSIRQTEWKVRRVKCVSPGLYIVDQKVTSDFWVTAGISFPVLFFTCPQTLLLTTFFQ